MPEATLNMLLQWGRNLTVAEGQDTVERYLGKACSLQWGRNLTVAEGGAHSAVPPGAAHSFNGAAT